MKEPVQGGDRPEGGLPEVIEALIQIQGQEI
jgi:hypothetical protein